MTRSFGEPERQANKQPELHEQGERQERLDSPDACTSEQLVQPVRIDFGKRFVAGIIDLLAANLLGYVLALVPLFNSYISFFLPVCAALLVRDWLYEGRGIGKNLMGLQVVSMKTGIPATLWQSIKRNVVIWGPPLVLYIVLSVFSVLGALHVTWTAITTAPIIQALDTLGFLYLVVVVPYEAYRAYNRPDGRRLGDEIAGTAIVEAPMDFSRALPRQGERRIARR